MRIVFNLKSTRYLPSPQLYYSRNNTYNIVDRNKIALVFVIINVLKKSSILSYSLFFKNFYNITILTKCKI